jgi:hypothetical protein
MVDEKRLQNIKITGLRLLSHNHHRNDIDIRVLIFPDFYTLVCKTTLRWMINAAPPMWMTDWADLNRMIDGGYSNVNDWLGCSKVNNQWGCSNGNDLLGCFKVNDRSGCYFNVNDSLGCSKVNNKWGCSCSSVNDWLGCSKSNEWLGCSKVNNRWDCSNG